MTHVIAIERRTYSSAVAEKIRIELARRMVKQTAVASFLGITQSSVSSKVRGVTPFTLDELGPIAELLDVEPAELLAPPAGPTSRAGPRFPRG